MNNFNKIAFYVPGPSVTFVGVVGFQAELECDVQAAVADDQLQLILWYKEGHPSPIYT